MSAVKWIKLSTQMFKDDKIRLIETMPEGDSILVVWVKLLALAGEQNQRGEIIGVNEMIPYTDDMLATIFHRKLSIVKLALRTFSEFRMIQILDDKTIVICNWSKHQNVDGLEKIRQDNAERVKRFRSKQRGLTCNVTGNVTGRDSVTPMLHYRSSQSKKEEVREEPLPSPKGDLAGGDLVDLESAQQWFNQLFKRKRAWTAEEESLLSHLLPISREDRQLIDWARGLPASHSFHDLTKLKQELVTLLRGFGSEIDKIKTVRKQLGLNGAYPNDCSDDLEPDGWRAIAEEEYPGVNLPETWPQLSAGVRSRIQKRLSEPRGWRDAALEHYGETVSLPEFFDELPGSVRSEILTALQKHKMET